MKKAMQERRSPATLDLATHAECLEFVQSAITENDQEYATYIADILKHCCQNGYADRATIWAAFTPTETEQQQFQALLVPIAHHFAKRIKDAIGWSSPGVALGIDCDLEAAIDRSEVVAADVVEVVGDRDFLDFQELIARCPQWWNQKSKSNFRS